MTHVDIVVANVAAPDAGEKIRGATYSVVPSEILARPGITRLTDQVFKPANGDRISRKKGGAVFRFGDRVGVADVIFGESGDSKLLGAFTLAALGPSLDPRKRELNELPMLL